METNITDTRYTTRWRGKRDTNRKIWKQGKTRKQNIYTWVGFVTFFSFLLKVNWPDYQIREKNERNYKDKDLNIRHINYKKEKRKGSLEVHIFLLKLAKLEKQLQQNVKVKKHKVCICNALYQIHFLYSSLYSFPFHWYVAVTYAFPFPLFALTVVMRTCQKKKD